MEFDVGKIAGKAVARVVAMLVGQREKGLAKYGVAVEDAPLTSAEWIKHAQEEACDFLIYTVRAAEVIEEEKQKALAEFAALIADICSDPTRGDSELRMRWIADICDNTRGNLSAKMFYAQMSQLQEFTATDANLLTLSRVRVFPFFTPIKVIG